MMHIGSLREIAPLSIVILSQTEINRLSAHYEHLGPAFIRDDGLVINGQGHRDNGGGWAGTRTNLVL